MLICLIKLRFQVICCSKLLKKRFLWQRNRKVTCIFEKILYSKWYIDLSQTFCGGGRIKNTDTVCTISIYSSTVRFNIGLSANIEVLVLSTLMLVDLQGRRLWYTNEIKRCLNFSFIARD